MPVMICDPIKYRRPCSVKDAHWSIPINHFTGRLARNFERQAGLYCEASHELAPARWRRLQGADRIGFLRASEPEAENSAARSRAKLPNRTIQLAIGCCPWAPHRARRPSPSPR